MVRQILLFTIPLFLGNILQQLYNTVDVAVVGRYVSSAALAAVGSSSPIINILVGFYSGVSTGACAVIARLFGAEERKQMQQAVHTTLWLTLLLGGCSMVFGIVASPTILRLMRAPEDVFVEAVVYLRIYFCGIWALMLYNMGSAILQAVGDSKRPLYFLCFTSGVNIVLDVLFVVVFHWGIAGVAWATVIAQALSAALVLWVLYRQQDLFGLRPREIRCHRAFLSQVLQIGLPSGLQRSITSISNAMVQSYVNLFGTMVMAGFSAYMKVDVFLGLPMQSLSLAIVTFVGQNMGAGKLERAKKGVFVTAILVCVINISCCLFLWLFGREVLGIFSTDQTVLDYGEQILRLLLPFYFLLGLAQLYAGALRGFGDAVAPMGIMIGCYVVLRQVFLWAATRVFHSVDIIIWNYPITWFAAFAVVFLYYKRGKWQTKESKVK